MLLGEFAGQRDGDGTRLDDLVDRFGGWNEGVDEQTSVGEG